MVNAARTLTYIRSRYVRVKAVGASGLNSTYVRLGVGYRRQELRVNLFYTLRDAFRYPISLPSSRMLRGAEGLVETKGL